MARCCAKTGKFHSESRFGKAAFLSIVKVCKCIVFLRRIAHFPWVSGRGRL